MAQLWHHFGTITSFSGSTWHPYSSDVVPSKRQEWCRTAPSATNLVRRRQPSADALTPVAVTPSRLHAFTRRRAKASGRPGAYVQSGHSGTIWIQPSIWYAEALGQLAEQGTLPP